MEQPIENVKNELKYSSYLHIIADKLNDYSGITNEKCPVSVTFFVYHQRYNILGHNHNG